MTETDIFLEHHGIKGMRWGHRKPQEAGSDSSGGKKPRLSRKEVRKLNREGREKFYQDKARSILSEAAKKGDDVLIQIVTPDSTYPTVVTGREFTKYASKGGMFDIRTSDVWARKSGDAFEANANFNASYKKIKR